MTAPITPSKNIAGSSSKFQQILVNKLQDSVLSRSQKLTFFDSLKKQPDTEVIRRRADSKRHPMTGISGPRSQSNNRGVFVSVDNQNSSHKLNPRILETWLNSTVSDAEDFNVSSEVLRHDSKLPLVRYGIDRSALLASGLSSLEIDRLYRSLFVHSIGFYQLILKILDHTDKKYSIVAGIWKVFAILLEYCCQLDYQMIIKTLNIEKKEELEQLENEFKGQISLMEEQEKRLIEGMNTVKSQLKSVQVDLQKEIEKREELEDEIMQRGSGHEEEVAMRLLFESKLNQMYAKQRDLTTRLEQLTEVVQDQQKTLDSKTEQVSNEKKKANNLIQGKIEAEQELKKIEDRYNQIVLINVNLENRIDATIKKIEDLSITLGKTQLELTESYNEIAQKKLAVEDQQFENNILKMQVNKLESIIQEYFVEKKMYADRITELQNTYAEEFEKNKHFQQEYFLIKESEIMNKAGFLKYKEKADSLEKVNEVLERERDKLAVALDSSLLMENEVKNQLKRSQEKMEEMNKGRRIVEELNEHLKMKLDERTDDLKLARQHISDLKTEIDNLRNNETELNSEITNLNIKIKSIEKQFETTKETLQDKINNLNEILTSEKRIRENWIYRYEEEQKQLALVTKTLIFTEDKLNDSVMKCNSLAAGLEEKVVAVERFSKKNKELFEEVLNLRSLEEDVMRKNKTLTVLMNNIEKDNKERILELFLEFEETKAENLRNLERVKMENEEIWHQALMNLENFSETSNNLKVSEQELEKVKKELSDKNEGMIVKTFKINQFQMQIEDFQEELIQSYKKTSKIQEEFEDLRLTHYDLQVTHQNWLNKIPENLRKEKNPFVILEDKILALTTELNNLLSSKENLLNQQTQYNYLPDLLDVALQTDQNSNELEKKFQKVECFDKGAQVNFIEVTRASITGSIDSSKNNFSLKKLNVEDLVKTGPRHSRYHSSEFMNLEEEGMNSVVLRSIYRHSDDAEEEKIEVHRLPSIGKKLNTTRPPTVPTMLSSEIKRHIRQANSRRKNDFNVN